MRHEFHLAIGQSPGDLATTQDRLDWLDQILRQVAEKGSDILLLPELFAIGYNIGNQVITRAEYADGPTSVFIASLAKTYGVAIHYGFSEKGGDKIYNASQCFGPDGSRLGGHRKLVIPPGFEQDYFSAGEGCTLFTYRGVKIATLICYDAEFPEAVRFVASLGAELILVPTALGAQWEWVSQRMIPTRAYENGVYLAYANSAGVENGMSFLGQSFIASPDGQELARAGSQPELIYGALKPDKVSIAQSRLPYLKVRKMLRLGIV